MSKTLWGLLLSSDEFVLGRRCGEKMRGAGNLRQLPEGLLQLSFLGLPKH